MQSIQYLHTFLIVFFILVLNVYQPTRSASIAQPSMGSFSFIKQYRWDVGDLFTFQNSIAVSDRNKHLTKLTINCKHPSLFLMYMLIIQCGDVEVQPGPMGIKYQCGICAKRVSWNSKAIQCDGCDVWYHSKCTNISDSMYSLYGKSSITWICQKCGIPNVSSSFIADISSFETTNPYNIFSGTEQDQPCTSTPLKSSNIIPMSLNVSKVSHHRDDKINNITYHMDNNIDNISSHDDSITSDQDISSSLSVGPNHIPPESLNHINSNDNVNCRGSTFNLLVVNFQSIRNKKMELHHVISSLNPDVIIGSETHLNPAFNDAEIYPHNIENEYQYKVFRKDRTSNICNKKGGGGVIILVKPCYDCEECLDLDVDSELKWVKLTTNSKTDFLVGSFYREPESTLDVLDNLNISLTKIQNSQKYKNCIVKLGGDFNLGDINWDNTSSVPGARDKAHCDKLCNITRDHLLEQINSMPTRQGRILDLLFTSHPNTVNKHTTCPPIGLSDHDMLLVNTTLPSSLQKREKRTVFIYKKANWDKIKMDLCSFRDSLLSAKLPLEVEKVWCDFKSMILKTMDNNIPTKSLRKKADLPWMSSEIRKLIRKRNRMHKRLQNSISSSLSSAYRDIKKRHQISTTQGLSYLFK